MSSHQEGTLMATSLNPSTQGAASPVAASFSPLSQADLSTYWLPLEQLAHHEPLSPAQRERAQQCLEQATAQVQRLWALLCEVQETRVVPLPRVTGRIAS